MKNVLMLLFWCALVISSISCAKEQSENPNTSGETPQSSTSEPAESEPTSTQPDDAASQADLQAIQGTWQTVSMITEGKGMDPAREEAMKNVTVTFDGNRWIKKNGDKVMMDWIFAVDASTSPGRMTINRAEEGEEEKLSLLIYKIEGDKLTTLSGSRKYPTEFTEQTVKGCYLTEYVRVKE